MEASFGFAEQQEKQEMVNKFSDLEAELETNKKESNKQLEDLNTKMTEKDSQYNQLQEDLKEREEVLADMEKEIELKETEI